MDNVTHTLFALTLARTRLGRIGRGSTTALVLASNAPDVDIITAIGGGANYMKWHRGPTHGPLGVIGLGLLTAGIVWSYFRWRGGGAPQDDGRADAPFLTLAALSSLAVLLHVLMDLPTSYGTRLLSPFNWQWFAVDLLPIIDIYLLMALAAGLAFGHMTPEVRRHNVAIALAVMAGNYVLRGVSHERALMLAPRLFGQTLPRPCGTEPSAVSSMATWPHPPVSVESTGRRCLVEFAALPTFLSPFQWRVVAHLSNAYEIHDVDILDRRFFVQVPPSEVLWRTVLRVPNQWTPAVTEAAKAPTAQLFLGFSRFPNARAVIGADGATTVRWTDLRFSDGQFAPNQGPTRPAPFNVTVRLSADNRIVAEGMGQ
jgi:membrane-bound metal-dependent hydrolase YbcI (DUF457 family)